MSWDNIYFKELTENEWEVHTGPGGKNQWRVSKGASRTTAPGPQGGTQQIMMLTTDIALTTDASYRDLVYAFAGDQASFENAFKHAWYKLTTRDMGPVERCVGNDVPPAQPFQYPLPAPPAEPANYTLVREDIHKVLTPALGAYLTRLAWSCASTFRSTDYLGGVSCGVY